MPESVDPRRRTHIADDIFGRSVASVLPACQTAAPAVKLGTGSNPGVGTDADDLLRFVDLPSRVVFETNASKIPLLEVIEEFGDLSEEKEGLVEGVVGFYEGVADLRSAMSAAKLQNRKVTPSEVSSLEKRLRLNAKFALTLSSQLKKFIRKSEQPSMDENGPHSKSHLSLPRR